ncbi:MAG: putative UDP-N-acetylglucosamine diphosphorylase 2 [Streblomastix strix]|uniref:UDP-N-acetylglucosamine diphosphorylase n=1 Tax=Streblomastix strix TaxID=222440 RepID=A0A5J4VJR2_9EUKA|nr:MAG: putative UDP-N-acetylglucosamine diphosphorylase 2 [Streblomastix strix]
MLELLDELGLPESTTQQQLVNKLEALRVGATLERRVKIEPIQGQDLVVIKEQPNEKIKLWSHLGLELIANRKVGVVLLAGGLSVRLGFNSPKGCFTNPLIRLYLMTSTLNDIKTRSYFQSNNYFGLKQDEEQLIFFVQKSIAVVNYDGSLAIGNGDVLQKDKISQSQSSDQILQSSSHTIMLPNGNGGTYHALSESGILEKMDQARLEWVHFVGVDNILVRPADPIFLGACASSKPEIGTKVVPKLYPTENVGVFCFKSKSSSQSQGDNTVEYGITEYMEMTEEEKHRTVAATPKLGMDIKEQLSERLAFSSANIVSHLFQLPFLRRCCYRHKEIPYHIAKKESSYSYENIQVPGQTYKLEKFIFDTFCWTNHVATVEVDREEEFAPVKNKTGVDSPDTALSILGSMWQRWITCAGGEVIDSNEKDIKQQIVEISPLISLFGEGLENFVMGKRIIRGSQIK